MDAFDGRIFHIVLLAFPTHLQACTMLQSSFVRGHLDLSVDAFCEHDDHSACLSVGQLCLEHRWVNNVAYAHISSCLRYWLQLHL